MSDDIETELARGYDSKPKPPELDMLRIMSRNNSNPNPSTEMGYDSKPTHRSHSHLIGYDIGQKNDPSAVVLVKAEGDRYTVRYCLEIRDKIFQRQLLRIQRIIDKLPEPATLVLDASGMGAGVLEMAQDLITGTKVIIGYGISGGGSFNGRTVSKSHLLTELQSTIRQGRLVIPDRPETLKLRRQINTWKIDPESSYGRLKAVNTRNGNHHFDLAVALALAIVHHERYRRIFR